MTLAWTDAPGPTTGNAFVNDLDLVVHAGGHTYKGNVFAGGRSVTGGSADPRNNVENVFLPGRRQRPVHGRRHRHATSPATACPGNADTTDQDYALVVSNATPAPARCSPDDLTTATEMGDGDGFIEPGEQFDLNERLRNTGDHTATGVSGVVSPAAPRVTVPQPNSAYPNIPVDAVRNNATPFRVRLANNFTCGGTAELKLDLSTTQGDAEIPVSVPTSAPPGPALSRNSSDVPKAIPDGGTVTSTLQIAERRGSSTSTPASSKSRIRSSATW